MPDNQQEQNPGGEKPEASRVEELMAEKETALAEKDQRLAELEQAIASRDEQITALNQSVAELELRLTGLGERLAQAVSSYRALAVKYNPGVSEEQVTGDSVEEIDRSLASAQALINRLRQELEAEIAATRIPAGAPQRMPADFSALSPRDKIQYAIGERR